MYPADAREDFDPTFFTGDSGMNAVTDTQQTVMGAEEDSETGNNRKRPNSTPAIENPIKKAAIAKKPTTLQSGTRKTDSLKSLQEEVKNITLKARAYEEALAHLRVEHEELKNACKIMITKHNELAQVLSSTTAVPATQPATNQPPENTFSRLEALVKEVRDKIGSPVKTPVTKKSFTVLTDTKIISKLTSIGNSKYIDKESNGKIYTKNGEEYRTAHKFICINYPECKHEALVKGSICRTCKHSPST